MTAPELADPVGAPRRRAGGGASPRQGFALAIVGGDGSGKSTAVAATATWLQASGTVHRTHLGRPRPSLLTLAVKGPLYLVRGAGLLQSTRKTVDPATATTADFPGVCWALWHLLTARDRLRAYRRLRRHLDRGGVVVSDRWPLAQLHLMDGSKVAWILDQPTTPSRAARWLATAERRCYEQIGAPDLLVVLRLHPDLAVERRPDEEAGYVRRRNQEVYGIDWSQTGAVVVDASRPKDEVLEAIRHAVSERL